MGKVRIREGAVIPASFHNKTKNSIIYTTGTLSTRIRGDNEWPRAASLNKHLHHHATFLTERRIDRRQSLSTLKCLSHNYPAINRRIG